jgi:hypothetical protein
VDLPPALYLPADDGWAATALTIGPWDVGLQHAGPPAALLLREAERASGIPDGQTVRMSFDVLGPVPVGPVRTTAAVLRPGRRVELVEAELRGADDRPLMRLTAWRLRVRTDGPDRDAPPGETPRMPADVADSRPEQAGFFAAEVAYHRALEWRFATGSFHAPGPAAAWTRPCCDLVEGEPITPLQHLLVMTDAASGISAALDWTTATFANVEFTVSLLRPPRGEWLGTDATTHLGGTGAAQCFSTLHDADGIVGRSAHALFVEPR